MAWDHSRGAYVILKSFTSLNYCLVNVSFVRFTLHVSLQADRRTHVTALCSMYCAYVDEGCTYRIVHTHTHTHTQIQIMCVRTYIYKHKIQLLYMYNTRDKVNKIELVHKLVSN